MKILPNEITDQSLAVSSQQIAANCIFTFEFSVSNEVPAGGSIEITFPADHFEVPSSID